jgi:hypothetical protein
MNFFLPSACGLGLMQSIEDISMSYAIEARIYAAVHATSHVSTREGTFCSFVRQQPKIKIATSATQSLSDNILLRCSLRRKADETK